MPVVFFALINDSSLSRNSCLAVTSKKQAELMRISMITDPLLGIVQEECKQPLTVPTPTEHTPIHTRDYLG